MSRVFAVSGKGGTGKTSIAAVIVRCLIERGDGPVLAVDADPSSTLGDALELSYDTTLADIREVKEPPAGMPKPDYVRMALEEALVERPGCDLLVMGRPEGRGCYCAVNHLLRSALSSVAKRYKYVIVDNEAGMEHLSRRTTDDVDALLVVATPDFPALRTARTVMDTVRGNNLRVAHSVLLLNQASEEPREEIGQKIEEVGADRLLRLPESPGLREAYQMGRGVGSLGEDEPLLAAIWGNVLGLLDEFERCEVRIG